MTAHQHIQKLLDFIDASPSPSHAVLSVENQLAAFQFAKLDEKQQWQLQERGRYYVVRDDSSIIVFVMGQKPLVETGCKLIGAHTDSPTLRIKPKPTMLNDGLLRLGVEIYGGAILATFTDRDLSLAGRVSYKDAQDKLASCLIHYDKPLLRLPNLAIHMNRTVNEDGLKLQKQNELPLIFSQTIEQQLPDNYFSNWLQQQIGVDAKRIVSWDLNVYDTQKGVCWGANNEFYSDSQLDNLASCHAALSALLDETVLASDHTKICAFFDHEEIGSESQKGADGSFLQDVLQRMALASQNSAEDLLIALAKSVMISADMAHAYQPNFSASYDCEHKLMMNRGTAIKINANQRYASTSQSAALFIECCEQAGVPYQTYSHRNDLACGSTIGPMTASRLGIPCVDVGNPLWAMHSIRESAGVFDHHYLIKAMREFFTA